MSEKDKKPRILAIHAHPDDLELQCAGSLIRLRESGCEIVMVTMTAGDKGSAELPPAEISAVRKREAQSAAAMIGAEYFCLGMLDLEISFDVPARRIVTEVLRRARPDVVMTAPPSDYMADHEITSRLVRDACFSAAVPNYKTREWDPAPPIGHIPQLIYCDPIDGVDALGHPVRPEFLIDVTDSIEKKLEMLACHASQREWLRQQHGLDEYLDACRRFGQQRGTLINRPYAEGFRLHRGHPYPVDGRISDLLAAVFLS